MPRGRFLLLSLLAALLAGLVYLPGLPGGFMFDDIPNIVDNPAIHLTSLDADGLARAAAGSQLSGNMRILPTLTFALDYWRAGGADPATFKITNIAIHALTTLALAWFFRSLLLAAGVSGRRAQWLPLVLALAWAIHPLQVSSVLYIVQRFQTLGTLFLVLALTAYLYARQLQIAGRSGRTGLMAAALLWALALGCKEDSALLPAYTLALELTVLRFAAADPNVARTLRRGYLFATLAGIAAFLLLVVPGHWHWDAYGGRDFNSAERLLTQARMLAMYLWQIVVPLPQHMPFYYDWVQPSRGLLDPWTTLPSLLLVAGLLAVAWRVRSRHALFSLGVFIFFGAHAITSNVVGLELAFEHRNHFALIGAVLAIGSLLAHASEKAWPRPPAQAVLAAVLLLALGSATLVRARAWSDPLALARLHTELAPHSARAWVFLCLDTFERGGGAKGNNTHLDQAAAACSKGAELAPSALNNPALLLVIKTLRGDVTQRDWTRFQQRQQTTPMTIDNRRAPFVLMDYARQGVALDKQGLLHALATLAKQGGLAPFDAAGIGYFVMNDLAEPELAIPYFAEAIAGIPPNNAFPQQLGAELRAIDRPDLAAEIERIGSAKRGAQASPGKRNE